MVFDEPPKDKDQSVQNSMVESQKGKAWKMRKKQDCSHHVHSFEY